MQHQARFLEDGMYVERLAPARPTGRATIMMIHGGAHTGACYLATPDGRPGWAYRAVQAGHAVWLPDWPGSGKSGYLPPDHISGEAVVQSLGQLVATEDGPLVILTHSMSGAYGWALAERYRSRLLGVVGVAPAMPGNIQPIPDIVHETDEYIEVQGSTRRRTVWLTHPSWPTWEFVTEKLVGGSTRFPTQSLTAYWRALQPVASQLSYERQNIRGSQLAVAHPEVLSELPVLVMTGSHDTDHPQAIDGAIVDWLGRAGARAEFDYLPDAGIVGNGHMLMLENNSDLLLDRILSWIETHCRPAT